ncbi:MAG: Rieske (2Fe-2S) protein [Bacteroidota bacterium]
MTSSEWVEIPASAYQRLLSSSQGITQIKLGNKLLCLAKQAEEWYATSPKCPHQGAPLAGGHFNETGALVCPWHRFAFDLASGQSNRGGYVVNTYPLRWEGEQLSILLPRKKWWQL